MKVWKCDICNKEVKRDYLSRVKFKPTRIIDEGYINGTTKIDMCDDCFLKFQKYIRTKGAMNE